MVALRVSCVPKLVQVSWKTSGRAHDDVLLARAPVHCANHLALADRRTMLYVEHALALFLPLAAESFHALGIRFAHAITLQGLAKLLQDDARIGYQRQPGMFEGIYVGDIDIDKADTGVLKRSFRSRGEIAVTRSDA